MAFVKPMLASPMREGLMLQPGEYVAQEKFDGIRLIVDVNRERAEDLLSENTIITWSRDGILHAVPRHLRDAFGKLPSGTYDGELFVPGKRSYGATRLDHADRLQFAVFDLLTLGHADTQGLHWHQRHKILTEMFAHPYITAVSDVVTLAETRPAETFEQVIAFRDEVWSRDGEGLILKHRQAIYAPGKRSKLWIKIKQLKSASLKVVGFAASIGEIENRGDFAMAILQDDAGLITSVKTRNNEWLARLERESVGLTKTWTTIPIGPRKVRVNTNHPRVNTLLYIEYQEQTPDGSYRHPRWDRWANE